MWLLCQQLYILTFHISRNMKGVIYHQKCSDIKSMLLFDLYHRRKFKKQPWSPTRSARMRSHMKCSSGYTLIKLGPQGCHLFPDIDEEPHDCGGGYHACEDQNGGAGPEESGACALPDQVPPPVAAQGLSACRRCPVVLLVRGIRQELVVAGDASCACRSLHIRPSFVYRVCHQSVQFLPFFHFFATSEWHVDMRHWVHRGQRLITMPHPVCWISFADKIMYESQPVQWIHFHKESLDWSHLADNVTR